jgi:enediyne biosynthesis protein E4
MTASPRPSSRPRAARIAGAAARLAGSCATSRAARSAALAVAVSGAALTGILLSHAVASPAPAGLAVASGATPAPAAPATAGRASARFVNVAASSGLVLQNVSGEIEKTTINETVGNGVCLQDVDDDGLIDVFLPNGSRAHGTPGRETPRSALYRNRGDGTFEDITSRAGVGSAGYWAQGCVFADYDGDGRADLLLTGFGRYILYRSLGGGRFQDVTAAAGLSGGRGWSTSAAFADYDLDGWIDLYVSHYVDYDASSPPLPKPGGLVNCFYRGYPVICGPLGLKGSSGRLFHNDRGRFRDVTRAAGLHTDAVGYGMGVIWSDFDLDGDPDLYVANDSTAHYLYRNDGGGRFTEIGAMSGVAYNEEGRAQAGMGVDSGDFDNDGRFDLVVTNFSHDYSTLYHNDGALQFQDVSLTSGFGPPTMSTLGWGAGFLDYDNDGRNDIFLANGHVYPDIDRLNLGTTWKEHNQLFHNEGGRFREVTAEAGPGFQELHSARGSAFGDLDNDGDVDILVNNIDEAPSLLRNEGAAGNHWIGFRLVGRPHNTGAIGARVTVIAAGGPRVAEVHAGSSHNSSGDPRLHFGLGTSTVLERVEIRWPRGRTQTLTGLVVDRYHTLKEPP